MPSISLEPKRVVARDFAAGAGRTQTGRRGTRGIAKRAFLTTKAVEANLTRVYRKLGITSRGGLARALEAPDQRGHS